MGDGVYVFVYCNGQKCKKIKQSLIFGWICIARVLFIFGSTFCALYTARYHVWMGDYILEFLPNLIS